MKNIKNPLIWGCVFLLLFVATQGVVRAQTCNSLSTEYSNYFRNQANFIPDIDTKIKTIRLNYHFIQTSINGPGNFETSNSTHMAFWNSVETKINYFFSNLAAPYNDLSCICGSNCHIADSRIRVKFENFIEHTDNVLYGVAPFVFANSHHSLLINGEKVLNIFDVGSNGSAVGGSVWEIGFLF